MPKISGARFAAILLLLIDGSAGCAQPDWPHLRGPNYDAVSTEPGLVESWPERGPPVLWSIELGQGYSGFVVGNGRAFTQFQSKTGQYVLAIDADSGAELWRTRTGPAWQPWGAYPGPYATPTWHHDRVYYTTPLGKVGCIDATNGQEIWSVDLRQRFGLKGVDFGYAASPLVEAGRVVLPVGGTGASVAALSIVDGSTAWSAGNDPASYCPVLPITLSGRRLIVAYLQHALVLHDAATGERLLRHHLSDDYDEHSAWPLFSDPYLLIASPFKHGAQAFRFTAEAHGVTGRPSWNSKALSNDVCSSVLYDGHVYGFDLHQLQSSPHRASRGAFKCLELATGATKWQTDAVGQATALVADGKLILLNDTGTLILAQANANAYEELARTKVFDDGICWTAPTLSNRRLIVRSPSKAVCLYLGEEDGLDPNRPLTRHDPNRVRFDWSRFLPREPEFPHDAPTRSELASWYLACIIGVFVPALMVAAVVRAVRRLTSKPPENGTKLVFSIAAFGLSAVGTTIYSEWADTFLMTWPAGLYVSFRIVLAIGVWAGTQPKTRTLRVRSSVMLMKFLGICWGYYHLCALIGYSVGWCFLIGFLPAMPPATMAAKQGRSSRGWLLDAAGFTVYFWCSGLLPQWKSLAAQ